MTLILHNREKGLSPYGERYKSPSFRLGNPFWWRVKRFLKRLMRWVS